MDAKPAGYLEEALANVTVAQGEAERAVVLFSASAALRERLAAPVPPVDRDALERGLDAARASSLEAGIGYALRTPLSVHGRSAAPA